MLAYPQGHYNSLNTWQEPRKTCLLWRQHWICPSAFCLGQVYHLKKLSLQKKAGSEMKPWKGRKERRRKKSDQGSENVSRQHRLGEMSSEGNLIQTYRGIRERRDSPPWGVMCGESSLSGQRSSITNGITDVRRHGEGALNLQTYGSSSSQWEFQDFSLTTGDVSTLHLWARHGKAGKDNNWLVSRWAICSH